MCNRDNATADIFNRSNRSDRKSIETSFQQRWDKKENA